MTYPFVARHGMTSHQYQSEFDKYVGEGYRLVDVSGYGVKNEAYYAAIWVKEPAPAWVARHGMTSDQYQSEFDKYVGEGYRLTHVSGYGVGGEDYYAAIWAKESVGAWVARHRMTSDQYQSEFDKYVGEGFRLVDVSGYSRGGEANYAAIWVKEPAPAWVARHGMTSNQYQSEFDKYVGEGYRLTHVSGYGVGDEDYYAAIWAKESGGAWVARHRMTSDQYQNEFDKYVGEGYSLVDVSGYSRGDEANYAAIWVK